MPDIEQQLAEVRQKAETAKGEHAKQQARLELLQDRLQTTLAALNELGCETVEEAESELAAQETQIAAELEKLQKETA